jgi:nitrogen fixation/metabolism regulation signal transduction histidine kinase
MLIRTKLHLGYLVIFVLAVCIGIAMIWAVRTWQAATEDFTYSHAQSLRAERLRGDMYRQIKEILDRLVSGDTLAKQEFESLGIRLKEEFTDLRTHAKTKEELELIDGLETAHRRVSLLVRETFALLTRGSRDLAVRKVESELEQVAFKEQDEQINRLRAYYDAASGRSRRRTLAIGARGEMLAGIIILLGLIWGGGLLFGIQRWLVRPLQAIGRSTAIISTGDLSHHIRVRSSDELSDLAVSINTMADALKRIQERLVQAERLAAVGELSSYIAHNIRNPLASIRSSAQAALEGTEVSAETRATLKEIVATVDHLKQWVHNFLFAFKPITPKLIPREINRVIEDALHVVHPMIEAKQIQVEMKLAGALPLTPLDEGYVEQALVALLTNACDATPPGKTISITSRLIREGESAGAISVDLADDGGGIPPEILQKVFTPYFTTKRDGVGLGLTMAQKIISSHGGSLSVSNRPDGGTAVRVLLPLSHLAGIGRDG